MCRARAGVDYCPGCPAKSTVKGPSALRCGRRCSGRAASLADLAGAAAASSFWPIAFAARPRRLEPEIRQARSSEGAQRLGPAPGLQAPAAGGRRGAAVARSSPCLCGASPSAAARPAASPPAAGSPAAGSRPCLAGAFPLDAAFGLSGRRKSLHIWRTNQN